MIAGTAAKAGTRAAMAQGQSSDLRAIYVASVVVLLAVAFVAQVLRVNWRPWFPGSEGERSMVDAVKAAVSNFMPHLE